MNDFFLYLIKSGLWIIVFWTIYHLFLRKEKFFFFNRVFLFSGMLVSLFFPFLEYKYTVEVFSPILNVSFASDDIVLSQCTALYAKAISWKSVLLVLYEAVVSFLCIRTLFSIYKLRKIVTQGSNMSYKDKQVINLPSYPYSFSFVNKIILGNSDKRTSLENELIIEHENAHIDQKHWIDLLLIQLLSVVQWFNPFIRLYSKAMKENLEYLADEEVLKKGISPVIYQAVLINSTLNYSVFNLTSSFTSNKFKRIKMMKKNASKPIKKFSALLLIPALGLFLWAFAEPKYEMVLNGSDFPLGNVEENEVVSWNDTIIRNLNHQVMTSIGAKATPLIVIDGVSREDIKANGMDLINMSEVQFADMLGLNSNEILEVAVLKDTAATTAAWGSKAANGVILVVTERGNNAEIGKYFFKVDLKKITAANNGKKPLVILNGKEATLEKLEKIKSDDIVSVGVLKDKAIDLYGEKGKDGVILLQTKEMKEK